MEKKRVLMVDDEDELVRLCGQLLERTGRFSVRTEREGLRAVEAAREFRPHLIFLDCQLPDRSGAEIAAELRADPCFDGVPIAFLTGSVSRAEAAELNASEGPVTFSKPFAVADFVRSASELAEGLNFFLTQRDETFLATGEFGPTQAA